MSDPVSWLIVAATSMKALGQIQSGEAQHQAAKYNARNLMQAGVNESNQAAARQDMQRRQADELLGRQRAAFAQSGGGMGGSALDVMQQSATNAELDAMMIQYEGDLRARGFEAQAEQERFAGQQARREGYMGAAGTILGGTAQYGKQKGW